ncbi:MAG TPA: endonuclease [Longimicrobium sp.]|nr:endonuclease [Longimicrobium sp.]
MSTAAPAFSTSPYPGLRPFHRHEADIFFGREAQTDQLLHKLQGMRFLAVVGPSGCGKSSLVRAGMIAGLEAGYMAAAGSRWRIAEMRPGSRPLRSLATTLVSADGLLPGLGGAAAPIPLVEAALRRGPRGLIELLDGSAPGDGSNLLLLVDQFEEIFRYRREGDPDEAEAFVSLLLHTAHEACLPVYVVITMRSDFLGDCAVFPGLPEMLNESMYLTPRMTREQCRQAIRNPAGVFGGAVDESLVSRMLNELDPDPDALPLLQHALMCLWTRAGGAPPDARAGFAAPAAAILLTPEGYDEIGRLEHALSRHADETFGELEAGGQEIARRLFTLLTDRADGRRDVRRPTSVREVMDVCAATLQEVAAVVEAFRRPDRSFLTPPAGTPLLPETLLDISHESLIRQWERLAAWVEREAWSASTYRRLMDTAQAWSRHEAELAQEMGLENARRWLANEAPTEAWATRYGTAGDFALVGGFIAESEAAEVARRRDRHRQRRRARALQLAIPGLLLLAAAFGGASYFARQADLRRFRLESAAFLRERALEDSLRRVPEWAGGENLYRAALAATGYYDPAADSAAASAYYRTVDPARGGDELFRQLSSLAAATHSRRLLHAPATYLYPWTDLHPDRALYSIYSGRPPFTARPLITVEEVVPRRWFSGRAPMDGDLHNQFAISVGCDRLRGEAALYDFPGYPSPGDTAPRWEVRVTCGLRRGDRFEPGWGKGAAARATLYFLVRYPGEITGHEFSPAELAMLLRWHFADPVSTYERHRNASIQALQGNRNPFVDHPEWAARIRFPAAVR